MVDRGRVRRAKEGSWLTGWSSSVGGHTHPVRPTAYKLREGSHTDPDGNLIRFGSPMPQ